jgi:hypothetical protein
LAVKDKEAVIRHKYKNKLDNDKILHDKIIENGLLFDEKDVIQDLDVFCQKFSNNHNLNIDDFIECINAEYLLSPRKQLTTKLHQQINNEKLKTVAIMSYYQKEVDNMMREIDDTLILEEINCDDDLRDFIIDKITKLI